VKGAEELLRPVVDPPQGLPPKKLIVWGFMLLMILMVLLSLITTTSEPPLKTSDEYAREVASKLSGNDKDNLSKGNTWVDEAYSSSGLAAQIAQGLVNPIMAGAPSPAATLAPPSAALGLNGTASTSLASALKPPPLSTPVLSSAMPAGPLPALAPDPFAMTVATPIPNLPAVPLTAGGGGARAAKRWATEGPARNSVDVAQEVEAINSKMMVADFDDASLGLGSAKTAAPHSGRSDSHASPAGNALVRTHLATGRADDLLAAQQSSLAQHQGLAASSALFERAGVRSPNLGAIEAFGAMGAMGAMGSNASTSVSDAGDEEGMRPTRSAEDDHNARAFSPRSSDGVFLKEFKAERPERLGLRSSTLESAYSVLEGSVIPAVLGRDVNSDLPGVITATVTQTVYDSLHSQQPLICKGAKLIGRYSNEIRGGQSRLLFAFGRLILRDGRAFNLPGFDGSDEMGAGGARADVDNHFFKLYGASLAIGVLTDRVSQQNLSPQGFYTQPSATGQILVQTTKEILQRNRDGAPTLSVANGTRINVEVRRDLVFPEKGLPSCG
jgi:type IV secretion system protein VirB10